jgi:hypothetical protein
MYNPRLLAKIFFSNSSGSAEIPPPAIYGGILFRLFKAMLENSVYLKNHYLFIEIDDIFAGFYSSKF